MSIYNKSLDWGVITQSSDKLKKQWDEQATGTQRPALPSLLPKDMAVEIVSAPFGKETGGNEVGFSITLW